MMTSIRYTFTTVLVAALLAACGDSTPEASPPAAGQRAGAEVPAAVPVDPATADPSVPSAEAGEPEGVADAPSSGGGELTASPGARAGAAAPSLASPTTRVTPAPQGAPDAAAILRRAEREYDAARSMEADFVQDLSVPLLNSNQRSRGKMYHRQPDRFLMKFSDPAGDVVVADGRHLWMYYPSSDPKQVMRASIAGSGQSVDLQREFLSDPMARYNATLNGTESVAGRTAYVLTLVPKQASTYKRIRLWVDQGDALVRRFEILEQNDALRRLELTNLKPNQPLGDALFRFTPPPGAQVFEQ